MSFQSKNQSSSGLNNPGNNLWIGEIENWMDEKYLTKSLESYSNNSINYFLFKQTYLYPTIIGFKCRTYF